MGRKNKAKTTKCATILALSPPYKPPDLEAKRGVFPGDSASLVFLNSKIITDTSTEPIFHPKSNMAPNHVLSMMDKLLSMSESERTHPTATDTDCYCRENVQSQPNDSAD